MGPTSFPSDAWRWRVGLGKRAQMVYERLTTGPVTTSAIAADLGITPRAVRYHLARLQEYQLAVSVLDGWIAGPIRPDIVAVVLDADLVGEEQRRRHAAHVRERGKWLRKGTGRKDDADPPARDAVSQVVSSMAEDTVATGGQA